MRVTKIIREYVEKTVNELPKFKNPTPKEIAYQEFEKNLQEWRESIEQEIRDALKSSVHNYKVVNDITDPDVILSVSDFTMIRFSTHNCELARKATTAKNARVKAKKEAIENILVNLELGATKADLDAMLTALAQQ